jgi:Mg2+ and Co2+ transporter CorA
MKYNFKETNNIQQMQDRFMRIQESLAQVQKIVNEFASELELVASQKRRDNHHMLSDSSEKVISGVRQFAQYIHKSPATAQKILNTNILQENAIAYRVGHSWTINIERLNQLIAEDPQILRCC